LKTKSDSDSAKQQLTKEYRSYQIENGEYSNWIFKNILEKEYLMYESDDKSDKRYYRAFTPDEMKIL